MIRCVDIKYNVVTLFTALQNSYTSLRCYCYDKYLHGNPSVHRRSVENTVDNRYVTCGTWKIVLRKHQQIFLREK